jgi:hypothetical protein
MNTIELNQAWQDLSRGGQRALTTFLQYPTNRNAAYVTGYLRALNDQGLINGGSYAYLLALTGQIEVSESTRKDLKTWLENRT